MHCLIVDAYSTGRYLPAALARRGVTSTHVQSSGDLSDFLLRTFPPDAFAPHECLRYDGDLDALVADLAAREPSFVVAGCESAVDLVDALALRLGVPAHRPGAGRVRRDKYDMATAVSAHGLRAPESLRTGRFADARSWARAYDRWPLVVKPADSAGTDNVHICANLVELCTAFDRVRHSSNVMGVPNEAVVVQEYLAGVEYFANTVSVAGRHHVCEIWRYHKRPGHGAANIYDFEEPVPEDDPAARVVRPYLLAVLDALGIRHGPAHTEIMLTDRGPVLIECGARLAGSIMPEVVTRCFGTNHVEATADALAAPADFATWADRPVKLLASLRYVSLISPVAGTLTSLDGVERLRALPSFAGLSLGVGVGDAIVPTVDSVTSPGVCYLVHDDPGQVEADYRALRALELDGLYAVG